jgi:membrane-associated protease RseP (regulator of RpoE activity)
MEQRYFVGTDNLVERLLLAVRRVMAVREVTTGGAQQGFAARFRGQYLIDPEQAYDSLEPAFAKEEVLLVTRIEGGEHVVLAMPGLPRPRASNPWINVLLFILTLLSMLMAGALSGYEGPVDVSLGQFLLDIFNRLPRGIPFAASLLAILLAHEFGHYFAARYHNTAVTLPYFLPFPGSPFGTLGAFIQLKQPPRNRKALLDIGLAGPLAGLIVAIPVLLYGLSLSEIGTLPASPLEALGQGLEGNSILYLGAKYLITGELLPAPVDYGGVSPVLYWIRYVFIGLPIPYGGRDVMLHPVAWAGWAGLLVTALNLIPAGQLDGGHALYVLLGRRAARIWPVIVVALILLGLVWPGWYLWAGLIFFLGRTYAQPLDEITSIDGRRKALAVFGLVLFVLIFMPVPLRGF